MKIKKHIYFILSINILLFTKGFAQNPLVKYAFNKDISTDSIVDETGNGYNAKLVGSATIKKLGKYGLLSISSTVGYADLTSKIGNVIGTLSNFTVSTYLFVDETTNLANNGNFVWTFSKSADILSNPSGCLFYTAKNSRYAICTSNYTTEKTLNINSQAEKGEWHHIVYVQSGSNGTIYIDGIEKKTGRVSLLPSTLGATSYNYLGKSSYSADQILYNSMMCDFRIYDTNLSSVQITTLASERNSLDTVTFNDIVDTALIKLSLGNLSAIEENISLPTTGFGNTSIVWSTSNIGIISPTGTVTRPVFGSQNSNVTLTATVTYNFVSKTKTFIATVIPSFSDAQSVSIDSINLKLNGNLNNLRSNLTLPISGNQSTIINWTSNYPNILSNSGEIISRPSKGSGNTKVTLTATIRKGNAVTTKIFDIYIAEDEGFAGYLFAYFTGNSGNQEAIRFALSYDGYVYNALNNNNPILNSAEISSSGGVRDPHILRGQNNDYYMVVTDMVSAKGWNSNRALTLLKSTDLINWQSSIINIPNTYAQYAAADRVWAPQTIYDPFVGKYMVYFAMRLGSSDYDKIYYAYANDRFLGFESAPKLLFDNNGLSTIDADIVYKDGKYELFFKTEGNGNGIKKAISNNLTEGYVLYNKYLQSTTNAVEGGCVFRMYNTDKWLLIYDMYTSGAYQFTQSEDLINFSVVQNPVSFDFTPRHGTIIPITSAEMQTLNSKWNNTSIPFSNKNDHILNISPNPTKNVLNISINNEILENVKISITEITGKKLLEINIRENNTKVDISSLKHGLYLVTLQSKNSYSISKKILIK